MSEICLCKFPVSTPYILGIASDVFKIRCLKHVVLWSLVASFLASCSCASHTDILPCFLPLGKSLTRCYALKFLFCLLMGELIISIVVSRVLVCEEVQLEFTFEKEGNKIWRRATHQLFQSVECISSFYIYFIHIAISIYSSLISIIIPILFFVNSAWACPGKESMGGTLSAYEFCCSASNLAFKPASLSQWSLCFVQQAFWHSREQ